MNVMALWTIKIIFHLMEVPLEENTEVQQRANIEIEIPVVEMISSNIQVTSKNRGMLLDE